MDRHEKKKKLLGFGRGSGVTSPDSSLVAPGSEKKESPAQRLKRLSELRKDSSDDVIHSPPEKSRRLEKRKTKHSTPISHKETEDLSPPPIPNIDEEDGEIQETGTFLDDDKSKDPIEELRISPTDSGIEVSQMDVSPVTEPDTTEFTVASFAEKPKPGKAGHKVDLQINMKPITLPKDTVMYRYDVEIVASGDKDSKIWCQYKTATKGALDDYDRCMKRQTCWDVYKKAVGKFKDQFPTPYGQVYDRNKLLFSAKPLPIPIICPKIKVEGGTYDLKIHAPLDGAEEIPLGDISKQESADRDRVQMQLLELITSQQLFKNGKYLSYGRNFYEKDRMQNMGAGRKLAEGFSKGVKLVEGDNRRGDPEVALQVDLKKSAIFTDQSAVDTIMELLKVRDARELTKQLPPWQRALIDRTFRGLRVRTMHRKRNTDFVVNEVTKLPACDLHIDTNDITVAQFFRNQYNELRFPNFPCFVRRTPKRKEFYPIEVCDVLPYQRVSIKQQTEEQMREMIRKTAIPPAQRLEQLKKVDDAIKIDETNKFLAKLHISIDPDFIKFEGRVLPNIRMQYKSQSRLVDVDQKGNWDMKDHRWFIKGKCEKFVALFWDRKTDQNKEILDNFVGNLLQKAEETGTKMPKKPVFKEFITGVEDLPRLFKEAEEEGVDFVLVIMQRKDEDMKSAIKYYEQQYSIVTQCVTRQNAQACGNTRNFKGSATMLNIVAKVNMKLGGLNFVVDEHMPLAKKWLADDVMFLGCDVNHPPPMPRDLIRKGVQPSEPSVVGMVGSTNNEKMLLSMDYYYQSPRVEEIESIREMVREMLYRFQNQHNGKLPKRIVFYRDGVADGQFKMVMEKEVPGMEEAFRQFGGRDYRPTLTMVICQKRHNTRLFPERMTNGRAMDQNIKPGTVVDKGVVHHREWEFYLCSHLAIQGTAKPVKYTVLRDDNNFTQDELQGLTFLLAHGHQIISKTVSLPSPVMGAHNAAMRGKKVWRAFNGSDEISTYSGERDAPNWADVSKKLRATEKLTDKCYWA